MKKIFVYFKTTIIGLIFSLIRMFNKLIQSIKHFSALLLNPDVIILILTSGTASFFINSYVFPTMKQFNDNTPIYWSQKIYLTNEMRLYASKIGEDNSIDIVKSYVGNNKTVTTDKAFEALKIYQSYMNRIDQLSKMSLQFNGTINFVLDDILNMDHEIIAKNQEKNLYKLNKNILQDILTTINKINISRNQLVNNITKFQKIKNGIDKDFSEFSQESSKDSDNNQTERQVNRIYNEFIIMAKLGEVRYDKNFGILQPTFFLNPIDDINLHTEKLLILHREYSVLYEQLAEKRKNLNTLANAIIYLITAIFLFYRQEEKQS